MHLGCGEWPRATTPEIFKFYEIFFRHMSNAGIFAHIFDTKDIKLILSTSKCCKRMLDFNWIYCNVFAVKCIVMLLLECFAQNSSESSEDLSRGIAATFKFVWFFNSAIMWFS